MIESASKRSVLQTAHEVRELSLAYNDESQYIFRAVETGKLISLESVRQFRKNPQINFSL